MGKKVIMKRALPMALAATMIFTSVPVMAAPNDLDGHWAEKVMTEWQEKGLIKGYEDGTVKPDNAVSRAEFVTMMNKAMGLTAKGEISFSDVKEGDWYYDAVAAAVAAGYCKGYDDGTFKPSATINRAEAAVMVANAAGLEADATAVTGFADVAGIPAWALGSVGAVVKAGYMSGYPDGTFGAAVSINRAEAISSLDRTMDDKTETPSVPDVEEVADVVIEESTTITEQTITGDLVIDEDFDGKVLVKDTVIEGDVIVKGCGKDAIALEDVTVKGKIIIETENAKVQLKGDTKVNTVEVTEDAAGTKVEVAKDATVETVVADAKMSLTGSGKVDTLEANADGITVNKKLDVADTEVADGVKKPTTSSSSGGGGGSSSGGSSSGGSSSGGSSSGGTVVTKTEVSAEVDNATFEFIVDEEVSYDQFAIVELTGATINATAGTDLQVTSDVVIDGLTVEAWTTDANGAARGEDVIIEFFGTPTAVTDGAVTYTVTIPASMLTIESNYQATKDVTVTFTVEVKDTASETLTEATVTPRYDFVEISVNDPDYSDWTDQFNMNGATIEIPDGVTSTLDEDIIYGYLVNAVSDAPIKGLEIYTVLGEPTYFEIYIKEPPTEKGIANYTLTLPKEYLVAEEGYKVSHDLEVEFTVIAYDDATTATTEKWNEIADSLQATGFEIIDGYVNKGIDAEIAKLDTEGYKVTAKMHTWDSKDKIAGIYLVVMNEMDYEDLVKKSIYIQQDPETVNKMALYAAIEEAYDVRNDPWVSEEDGFDVEPTDKWVTQSEYDELEAAITAAEKVYDAEDATQDTVDAAVTELNTAITAFKNAMKDGLYGTEPEEPDTEATEAAITEVTMSDNNIVLNSETRPVIDFTLENVTERVEVSAYVTKTEGTPAADVEPTDCGYIAVDEIGIGFHVSPTVFEEVGIYYVYYRLNDGEWVKAEDVITVTEPVETAMVEETSIAEEAPAVEEETPVEKEETTI
ncbi:S-layer homology domain-containing protein [Anaerotignum sp.]